MFEKFSLHLMKMFIIKDMKHKTSVLIVSSKDKNSNVIQVPTHLLMYWKRYIAAFVFMVMAIFLVSGFLIYQNTSQSYHDRLARARYVQSKIDLQKVMSTFASIDSGTYRINLFLEELGLGELQLNNAGGLDAGIDIVNINNISDFYDNQLVFLEETLQGLPLGKPHPGSISSGYGYRRNPFTGRGIGFHSGVDFRGYIGDTIRATGKGVVTFAGYNGGYGRSVEVKHSETLRTYYAHLNKIDVKKGDIINCGQYIGQLGNSGRSTGPHLHYEINFNNNKINPINYFNFEEKKSYEQ